MFPAQPRLQPAKKEAPQRPPPVQALQPSVQPLQSPLPPSPLASSVIAPPPREISQITKDLSQAFVALCNLAQQITSPALKTFILEEMQYLNGVLNSYTEHKPNLVNYLKQLKIVCEHLEVLYKQYKLQVNLNSILSYISCKNTIQSKVSIITGPFIRSIVLQKATIITFIIHLILSLGLQSNKLESFNQISLFFQMAYESLGLTTSITLIKIIMTLAKSRGYSSNDFTAPIFFEESSVLLNNIVQALDREQEKLVLLHTIQQTYSHRLSSMNCILQITSEGELSFTKLEQAQVPVIPPKIITDKDIKGEIKIIQNIIRSYKSQGILSQSGSIKKMHENLAKYIGKYPTVLELTLYDFMILIMPAKKSDQDNPPAEFLHYFSQAYTHTKNEKIGKLSSEFLYAYLTENDAFVHNKDGRGRRVVLRKLAAVFASAILVEEQLDLTILEGDHRYKFENYKTELI